MSITNRIQKLEKLPPVRARQDEARRLQNEARRRNLAQEMIGKLTKAGVGHDEARAYLIGRGVKAAHID
jgi:hypothetical protein